MERSRVGDLGEPLEQLIARHDTRNSLLSEVRASDPSLIRVFPKKKDSGEHRLIAAPSPRLKRLQADINKLLSQSLKWPRCVRGGVRGRSHESHAQAHVGKRWLLTIDIRHFFPSVKYSHLATVYRALGVREHHLDDMIRVSMNGDSLAQGFPHSSTLANLVLLPVDHELQRAARRIRIDYTRYIDDIAVSSGHDLNWMKGTAAQVLDRFGFSLNKDKSHCIANSGRQIVGGLIVNERLRPTKEYRRKVKDDIERCLNGEVDVIAAREGKLHDEIPAMLRGRIGHLERYGLCPRKAEKLHNRVRGIQLG